MSINIEDIRNDFPILKVKIYGKPNVFLDNAASTQKPNVVVSEMKKAYFETYANIHRGIYFLSNRSTELYESAREEMGSFINATSSDEIIFTKNATESINLVAYSWAMEHLTAGDEIILSMMEHHSNIIPWHFLREKKGVKLVFVPIDSKGLIHLDDFKKLTTSKTKLIALTHMSNVLGTIPPIYEIISYAKHLGIHVLVDGCQTVAHIPVDVQRLGCDWYVCTGHKLYGPSGIGILYGKKNILNRMRPFLGGGNMVENVSFEAVTYQNLPQRFEAGTPPIVEAIGLKAALVYLKKIGISNIHTYEKTLIQYFMKRIKEFENLKLLGPKTNRGPVFSFSLSNIHAYDLASFLNQHGISVRAGTHCAQPLLNHLNITSICRASLAIYNTISEIDFFMDVLNKAERFFNE